MRHGYLPLLIVIVVGLSACPVGNPNEPDPSGDPTKGSIIGSGVYDYYYGSEDRVYIERDSNGVAVGFRTNTAPSQIESFNDEYAAVEYLGRLNTDRHILAVLMLTNGTVSQDTLDDMTSDTNVAYANYTYNGVDLIVTDELVARFADGVGTNRIFAFNRTNEVAVLERTRWHTNTYLLRVTENADRNALEMANLYYESDLTDWADANLMGCPQPEH